MLLSGAFFLLRRVDPGCAWQVWRCRWLADEAFGVGEVGGGQDLGAPGPDGLTDASKPLVTPEQLYGAA